MTKQKKSTFKVLFYLKKNSPNKNGLAPIMGRITIDGKIAQFSTKLECDPNQWELKFGRISGRSNEAVRINERLTGIRAKIDKVYHDMMRDEGFATSAKVKNTLLGINITSHMLLDVYNDVISETEKMTRAGTRAQNTLENLKIVKTHVQNYISLKYKCKDIAFREIDKKFVRGFEIYLRTKNKYPCCNNTAFHYLLLLNQIVNAAIDRKIIGDNVISKYIYNEMEKDEPVIGYLTKQEIEHLATVKFAKKNDELYRDFFIFCCFTGLAYIDLKLLKWDKIRQFSDGSFWIITHRSKTKIPVNIKLLDTPISLMEKYKGLAEGDFVFPIPAYSTYRKALKRVLKLAGIEKQISTHGARHSFATLFLTEGVPIESVSKMLGHRNIKTTQAYAKVTNEKINYDMQAAAIKLAGLEKAISMAI